MPARAMNYIVKENLESVSMSLGTVLQDKDYGVTGIRPSPAAHRFGELSGSSGRTHLDLEVQPELRGRELPARIVIRSGERLILLEPRQIVWVQSSGDWLLVHSDLETLRCRTTMHEFQCSLDPAAFVRIHRSALVNLLYVREFSLPRSGNAAAHLNNGKVLPVSRLGRSVIRTYVATHCTF